MPRLALLLPALLLLAPAAFAAAGVADRCAAYVRPLDQAGQLSGTLVVARNGRTLYERSFGDANSSLGVANDRRTRHCVASLTKIMTIVLARRMMAAGLLGETDTLSRWLPDFPRAHEITVEMLLHHRAGIPHRVTSLEDELAPQTAASMVALAARKPLDFDPGTKASYSTAGYAVLARVLELAGGADYGDLLARWVFGPAGMKDSLEPAPMQVIPRAAQAYTVGLGSRWPATPRDMTFLVGGGSVYSTADDLLRFFEAIRTGVYGSDVRAELLGGPVSWNGISSGFQSFVEYDSTSGYVTILCGNVVTGANELLRRGLNRLCAGGTIDPPPVFPRPGALSAAERAAFLGDWRVSFNGAVVPIQAAGDNLLFNDGILVPVAPDTLFALRDYGRLAAVRGPDQAIEKLEWRSGGKLQVTLERVRKP